MKHFEDFPTMKRTLRTIVPAPFVVAVVSLTSGCGGSSKKDQIWIYQYPAFYKPDLKRIAVLPFGNRTRVRGVGERISDKVSAILTNNRTYEVYTRTHLKDIDKELKMAESGIIDAEAAKRIGRLKSVQALVCGVCNRCETTTRNETRYNHVPVWGTNAQGQQVIVNWRNVPYQWTRYDSFVECHVVVIDTATGRQITAVNRPSTFWAAGSPPKYTAADTLRLAEQDQVNRLVSELAVVRTPIRLEDDVMQTASSLYDNKWDFQRRIVPADEKFFVVVKLPPQADRNNFRITIVPKGERDVMAEQAFVWSKKNSSRGYSFKVKSIVEKRGFGDYQAKLYSGPEPIAWYDFTIAERR
jgi:hypothetical protein